MMHPKATWISVLISALAVTVLMSANAAINNLESYKFRYDFSKGTSVYLPASDYSGFDFVGANTSPTNGPNGASSAVTTTGSSWNAFSSATTLSNSWTVAASLSPAAVDNAVVFSVGRLNKAGSRAVAICTSSDRSKLLVRLMYRNGSDNTDVTCTEKEMTGLGDVTQGFHTLVIAYQSAAANNGTLRFYWDGVEKLSHTYSSDTKWFGVPDSPGGIQFNVLVSRGGSATNGGKTFVYENGIHSFYDFRFYAGQFDASDATAYAALYPADRMGSPLRPSAYVESGATNTIGDARNVATPMSYIDTEYKAKKGTEFVLDFQYLDCATVQQYIFGIYNGSAGSTPTEDGTTHCFYINGNKGFAFARFSETSADWHAITANNAADRIRRIVSVENTDDSSVTGSEATILTWADRATMASASTTKKHENDAKRNTYLFAVNTKDEAKRFTKARIYSFEADESGTPVIFLAPDMENGEAGFRNVIDGTFHGDGNKDNNPERPLRFYNGVGCASDYKYEVSTLYAKLYASSDDGGAVSIADGAAAASAEGWIPRGGTLALSATPPEGMEFSKWTGDTWAIADGCAATDASIEVSTPYAVQLRATFKSAVNARLTVAADGADSVNWSSADWRNANDDGEAISAPSDKEVTIVAHKSVTLTLDASVSLSKFIVQADANCVVTFASGAGGSFYAGEVVVSNGVLKQGTASVLGTTPTVTVENGGTFDFNKLNPDAATSYVIAGAGAGNWPWAMTSTGGTPANYVKNITLMDDATIGSAANSQLKVGCSSDPGAVDKRGSLTLNGHTLTVADGMWITHRYVNQPGTGTIYYSSRGTSFNEGALNSQGGETTLILGAEGGSNEIAVNNATWIHALDWRGYKINTSAALTINSSLAVSGGDKETAILTFADGATAVLSDNLAITTTLTANGALSLTRAAGVEDTIVVAATNSVSGSGAITVGEGVTLDLGKSRPTSATITMSEGAALMLQLKSDTEIPVLKVSSEIDSAKMTVFDKDGNEVPDFRATYDGEAGTMTIYAGVYVWTNADGTGSFGSDANWSVGSAPPSGKDFIVDVKGETDIEVSREYTLGNMEVRGGGTAKFAGIGSISVTKASVAAGTALVTGGKVTFPAIDLPAGATAMLPDPSMLVDGNLVGGGTLVLAPGEGITVTMSGGNKSWTGQTIIENGTVKYTGGRSFGNADTTANVLVKGGATLDQNGVRWLLENSEKPAVRLEEGAVLTSSGDIDDNKGGVITKLSLDGDATVLADEHKVYMSKHYNAAYVTIELGTNTLAKTGTNEFFISVCNITGTGTLDIQEGMVSVTHPYSGSSYGKCSNGTINIHEGAQFRFRHYNGKAANFSVSNLVLNGRVERDGADLAGTQLDHMLTVTGTLSGSGAARMLTLASGAALKPDGTGAPTVEEELVLPEDKLTVDLGGIDLGPRRQDIPLILVGDAALLPTAENIEFKNVTVYGERKDKLPVHWELKSTRTGTGYRLIRGGTTIYLR